MELVTFLEQGCALLARKLGPLGYKFEITHPMRGSGGPSGQATFKRGDREIHLWARYGRLGGVSYRFGDAEFQHHDHMRALGLEKAAAYPGFDDGDALGGFRRLLEDLDACGEFLVGNAASIAEKVSTLPPETTGFKALP